MDWKRERHTHTERGRSEFDKERDRHAGRLYDN